VQPNACRRDFIVAQVSSGKLVRFAIFINANFVVMYHSNKIVNLKQIFFLTNFLKNKVIFKHLVSLLISISLNNIIEK